MAKTIILKNISGSDIDLLTIGKTVFIGEDKNVSHVSVLKLRNDPTLISSIQSGDIVVNDGTDDLSATEGENYINDDFLLEVQDSSATISKYTKTIKFDSGITSIEASSGSAEMDAGVPTNMICVFKTGNDTTGDGSLAKPYLTIEYALSTISGSSSSNRFIVLVGPGIYIENNPLIIPTFTEVFAFGGITSIQIIAANPTSNLIEPIGIVNIKGFALSGTTSASLIYLDDVSSSLRLSDIVLGDCDIGIDCASGNIGFDTLIIQPGATFDTILKVTSGGILQGSNFYFDDDTISASDAIYAAGSESVLNLTSFGISGSGISDGLHIEDSSVVRISTGLFDRVDNAIRIGTSSELFMSTIDIQNTNNFDLIIEDTTPVISIVASQFKRNKVLAPNNYTNVNAFYLNEEPTAQGLRVVGNIVAGRPEIGTELIIGRGDPYTRGMTVLTTDNTATSTTDGGNLTDVTIAASGYNVSTFTFQGTEANHTILFGTDIEDSDDVLKFWGTRITQTTAAVETIRKSFVFERWTGSEWTQFGVMGVFNPRSYVYSKELFIRANQTEDIKFGLDDVSPWEKKTIDGKNLYWVRIRITNDLTTAPEFDQLKLMPSNLELNQFGVVTLHGKARYRRTILSTGNIFGESGAVVFANPFIGSLSTGWNHAMKNTQLNEIGDALYLQFVLPRGIDTSFPLKVKVYYQNPIAVSSDNGVISVLALPMEVLGVLAADESGGVTPIARTLLDINPITIDDAQIELLDVTLDEPDILLTAESDMIDVSDAYEGDMIAMKIEYIDDGDGDQNLIIWGVEISAVQWLLGDRL